MEYRRVVEEGLNMKNDNYNLFDLDKLKSKKRKFMSSKEALGDVKIIDWDITEMSDEGWDEYRRILDDLCKPMGLNIFELADNK